ncbi:MAG: heme exporter protein CcmD [Xanthobacteraceae bacterium]
MEQISHLPFIVGSYAAAAAIVAGLIAWVALDFRAQRRALAELELRGIRRRSAAAAAVASPSPMAQAGERT